MQAESDEQRFSNHVKVRKAATGELHQSIVRSGSTTSQVICRAG
jgi:hypothetical protein